MRDTAYADLVIYDENDRPYKVEAVLDVYSQEQTYDEPGEGSYTVKSMTWFDAETGEKIPEPGDKTLVEEAVDRIEEGDADNYDDADPYDEAEIKDNYYRDKYGD